MLSYCCPVCLSVLSVCDVGVLWPNGWIDQDETWYGGRPWHGHTELDGDPAPPEKRHSPHFSAHVYCGQTAGWMKTPLGTDVDIVSGHIVLDVDPVPLRKGTAVSPSFRPKSIVATVAHLEYC